MAIQSQGPQLAQTLQEFKAWIDSLSDRDKIDIVSTARRSSNYYSRGGRTRMLWNAYTHEVEPKPRPGYTTMYGIFNCATPHHDAQHLEAFEEWTDDAALRFTMAQQGPHHNTAYKEGKMILRDLDKADLLKCVELDKPVRHEDLVARLNMPGYGLTEALCYRVSTSGDVQKRMRSTDAINRALRVWLRLSARDVEVRRLLLEVKIDWDLIIKSYEEESNAKMKVQCLKEQLAGHTLQLAILRDQLDQIQPILKRIAQDVLRMKNGKVSCGFDVAVYSILRKGGLDPHLPVVSAGLDLDWTLDLLERADLVLDLIKEVELVRVSGDQAILDQKPPKLHKRGLPKARLVLRQEQVNAIRALEPVADHLAAVSPNAREHLDFYVQGLADGSILAD